MWVYYVAIALASVGVLAYLFFGLVDSRLLKRISLGAAVAGSVVWLAFFSFVTVQPGMGGLQLSFGKALDEVMGKGLNFKMPHVTVLQQDLRPKTLTAEMPTLTSDKQKLTVDISFTYRRNKDSIDDHYRAIAGNVQQTEDVLVDPAVWEIAQKWFATRSVTTILDERSIVKGKIFDDLKQWFADNFLELLEVSIGDIDFDDKYDDAIEDKQAAEESVKTARNTLEKQKAGALKLVETAKGDAAEMVNKAKGNAALVRQKAKAQAAGIIQVAEAKVDEYKRVGAHYSPLLLERDVVAKWDGIRPVLEVGDGAGANGLILNVEGQDARVVAPVPPAK